jgi:hypothetical protein
VLAQDGRNDCRTAVIPGFLRDGRIGVQDHGCFSPRVRQLHRGSMPSPQMAGSFTAYIITTGGASCKPRLDFDNKQMITGI